MKVLNLDKLSAANKRELIIGGMSYPILEMTVTNFIETTKKAQEISEAPMEVQIEATIELVLRSVPSITAEQLRGIPLEQLKAIVAFVRGEDDIPGVESDEAAPTAEGEEKK